MKKAEFLQSYTPRREAKMKLLGAIAVILCSVPFITGSISPSRLCVIENRVGNQEVILVFRSTTQAPSVQLSYGDSKSSSPEWTQWKTLGAPLTTPQLSNPVCDYTERNETRVFVQASDGQVYAATQDPSYFMKFSSWKKVGLGTIPSQSGEGALQDSLFVGQYGKDSLLFARSMSANTSQLYWCKGNSTDFDTWSLLGGSKATLGTDVTLILNPFSGRYEAFMVSPSGKIHRTWQHNDHSFADWRGMDFAPTFSTASRPSAQVMGYSIFNGKLMVAGVGTDNYIHQVSQTTCDGVDNPWGYCTWGSWYKAGGEIPLAARGGTNNLAMSRNVHFGVEMFVVDDNPGQMWQVWQLERGEAWHGWQKVPQDLQRAAVVNVPFVRVNDGGWWMAYALNSTDQIVVLEPVRSMNGTPGRVAWGSNLTVAWSVAVDEGTKDDWVAIFPPGASDDQYVDYRYVQGGLNPGKNPVQSGNITMASYLPDGSYQIRYLVNRKYVSVVDTTVSYYNQSSESEVIQLYRGVFVGLGVFNKGIEQCVDTGVTTVEKFEASFAAFKAGQIIDGLELLGTALIDIGEALKLCDEVLLAQKLEHFVKDLVECTESDCQAFVFDLIEELAILYYNEYEIYGDIKGAISSFDLLKAYQQGGLCVGRLVNACLAVIPGESPLTITDTSSMSDNSLKHRVLTLDQN